MLWLIIVSVVIVAFGFVVLIGAPYVPSRKVQIEQAFNELYKLTSSDVLVDIGSGDGIVLRAASKSGAHAVGYEVNPFLFLISWLLAIKNRLIHVRFADFYMTHLPKNTTVIYVFTASRYVKNIERKIQREVNRLGRPLKLIIYGNSIKERRAEKVVGAYKLYTFLPLQTDRA